MRDRRNTAIGSFNPSAGMHTIDCDGPDGSDSAITHSEGSDKEDLTFTWTPPSEDRGELTLSYVFQNACVQLKSFISYPQTRKSQHACTNVSPCIKSLISCRHTHSSKRKYQNLSTLKSYREHENTQTANNFKTGVIVYISHNYILKLSIPEKSIQNENTILFLDI